jgi:hypothetical protein
LPPWQSNQRVLETGMPDEITLLWEVIIEMKAKKNLPSMQNG